MTANKNRFGPDQRCNGWPMPWRQVKCGCRERTAKVDPRDDTYMSRVEFNEPR